MTDRDLLKRMIARIGKEPRAVKFDADDNLVELNLAGLDLKDFPEEVIALANLRALWLGEGFWNQASGEEQTEHAYRLPTRSSWQAVSGFHPVW